MHPLLYRNITNTDELSDLLVDIMYHIGFFDPFKPSVEPDGTVFIGLASFKHNRFLAISRQRTYLTKVCELHARIDGPVVHINFSHITDYKISDIDSFYKWLKDSNRFTSAYQYYHVIERYTTDEYVVADQDSLDDFFKDFKDNYLNLWISNKFMTQAHTIKKRYREELRQRAIAIKRINGAFTRADVSLHDSLANFNEKVYNEAKAPTHAVRGFKLRNDVDRPFW